MSHFNLFIGGNAFPGCRLPKVFLYILFFLFCSVGFCFAAHICVSLFLIYPVFVRMLSSISCVPLFAVQVNFY